MKLFEGVEADSSPSNFIDNNRVKNIKNKLNQKYICPSCGESNTEKVKYYWRCNNNKCEIMTYHPTESMELKDVILKADN